MATEANPERTKSVEVAECDIADDQAWGGIRIADSEQGGGAGSRTRVRRRSTSASTCVVDGLISRCVAPIDRLAAPLLALWFRHHPEPPGIG